MRRIKGTLLIMVMLIIFSIVNISYANDFNELGVVNQDKVWTIVFNDYAEISLDMNNLILVKDSSGLKVDTKLKLGDDGKSILVYPPSKGYNPGETYNLYIDQKVKSTRNNSLEKAITASFIIEEDYKEIMKEIAVLMMIYDDVISEGDYSRSSVQVYLDAKVLKATDLESAKYKLEKLEEAIMNLEFKGEYDLILDDIELVEKTIYEIFGDLSELTEKSRREFEHALALKSVDLESAKYKLNKLDDVLGNFVLQEYLDEKLNQINVIEDLIKGFDLNEYTKESVFIFKKVMKEAATIIVVDLETAEQKIDKLGEAIDLLELKDYGITPEEEYIEIMKAITDLMMTYDETISELEGYYPLTNIKVYLDAKSLKVTGLESARYKLERLTQGLEVAYITILDEIKGVENDIHELFGDLSELTQVIRQEFKYALSLNVTDLKSAKYKLDKLDDAFIKGFEFREEYKRLLEDIEITERAVYEIFGDLSELTEESRQAFIYALSLKVTDIESAKYKLDKLDEALGNFVFQDQLDEKMEQIVVTENYIKGLDLSEYTEESIKEFQLYKGEADRIFVIDFKTAEQKLDELDKAILSLKLK